MSSVLWILGYLAVGVLVARLVTPHTKVVREYGDPDLEYWINQTPTVFYQHILGSTRFAPVQYVLWCVLAWPLELVVSVPCWLWKGLRAVMQHLNTHHKFRFVWEIFYKKQVAEMVARKLMV
jgi:hypothetical protein